MGSVSVLGPVTVRDIQEGSVQVLRSLFHQQESAWPQGLSEEQFFQDLSDQGLVCLFFHHIKLYGLSISTALTERLRQASLSQAAAHLILELDLRQVLQALAQQGIKALLLKGAALSHSLYPDPNLRPRCDVDILVPESQRQESWALLEGLGYRLAPSATALSSQRTYCKQRQGIHCAYDIHWHISNSNRSFSSKFIQEGLLDSPQALPVLGPHAFTLNAPASLIYACFHRAGHFSHSGDRLIWLYDMHLLCQVLTPQEAEYFCTKAKALAMHTLAADAIRTAQYWFATPLPPVLASFVQNPPKATEEFALLLREGRQQGIKNHTLLEMQSLATWRQRASFLLHKAFPPPKYMLWRYETKKRRYLPLLYVRRFLEALWIFIKKG